MLVSLSVKNFAIIEDLTVDFKSGMTVLTGQTGAGKSLIIDSISLLLGKRSDSDMIRYGEIKAQIKGIFTYDNEMINSFLEKNNIPILPELTIYREIQKTRSIAKINNTLVSLQMLKELANFLADIHVQHDTYALFNPDTYIYLIDKVSDFNFNKLYNEYQIAYLAYLDTFKEYEYIQNASKEKKDKLDYLEFSYKEISSLKLTSNEDEQIEEKINKLKNFDKIFNALKIGLNNLDNEYFSIDNIYLALKEMERIKNFDQSYANTFTKLEEAYYNLEDSLSDIRNFLENLDYDEEELNHLNERLTAINNLKLKYHKSLEELIKYEQELQLELSLVNNYDQVLNEALINLKQKHKELVLKANNLTELRKKRARIIENDIIKLCQDLELPHTKFEIYFKEIDLSDYKNKNAFRDDGVDLVEFMLSTNLGEPVLPLSKVASGGELSRIMLAFKTYFAKESKLSLLIFDEIDSGVSGHVAFEIAKKMKEIAQTSQVLAITHLPQVAGIADNQYFIYKEEKEGRTYTNFKVLTKEERITEIAHMLSGDKVSKYALEAAKEILNH